MTRYNNYDQLPICSQCDASVASLVRYDQGYGQELNICRDCLMKGLALLRDRSKEGPCPPDCPICRDTPEPQHDMTASQHTGEAPDGLMDLCPKCVEEQPMSWHYKGDWHRQMIICCDAAPHAADQPCRNASDAK